MAGQWKTAPLTTETVTETRPEIDWLDTVIGRRASAFVVTLSLTQDAARALLVALAEVNDFRDDVPDFPQDVSLFDRLTQIVLGIESPGLAISQSAFDRFAGQVLRSDAEGAEALLDVVVSREDLAAFRSFARITGIPDDAVPGATVLDVVAADDVDPAAFTRLNPPPVPSGPKADDDGTVLMAIIDEGIGVLNDRFRYGERETRIEYFLDMDALRSDEIDALGAVRDPLTGAREWSKEVIEAHALTEPDEAAGYRRMGLIDSGSGRRQPHLSRITHGTHVLDRLAGFDRHDESEREASWLRPILAVQLPLGVAADRTDAEMDKALALALGWIGRTATTLRPHGKLPLVVNFSFGNYAGPHDGTGRIEKVIADFIAEYRADGTPCEVVLPAGNSFQSRVHARVTLTPDEPEATLTWRVDPEDRTSSFVQLWLPPDPEGERRQRIAVKLIPPQDAPEEGAASVLDSTLSWALDDETVLARLYHQKRSTPNHTRERVTLCLRPTSPWEEDDVTVPSGDWTIQLKALEPVEPLTVEARIQRDDPVSYEPRRGRQSTFRDDGYRTHDPLTGNPVNRVGLDDGPVQRDRTLSIYATGEEPLVVGGYMDSDGTPARYSSAGPTGGARRGPDLAAVSEVSPAFPGVLATGTYSGSWARLGGTSVAAPAAARALADAIAAGGTRQTFLDSVAAIGSPVWPDIPEEPATVARCGIGRLTEDGVKQSVG